MLPGGGRPRGGRGGRAPARPAGVPGRAGPSRRPLIMTLTPGQRGRGPAGRRPALAGERGRRAPSPLGRCASGKPSNVSIHAALTSSNLREVCRASACKRFGATRSSRRKGWLALIHDPSNAKVATRNPILVGKGKQPWATAATSAIPCVRSPTGTKPVTGPTPADSPSPKQTRACSPWFGSSPAKRPTILYTGTRNLPPRPNSPSLSRGPS